MATCRGQNPPLYRVMLFTKRDGTYKEYMPLRIGFGGVEFAGGKFLRFGKELQLKKSSLQRRTSGCEDDPHTTARPPQARL